jgi:RNA polymerase sigma factor (sigma-70 family)
LVALRADDVDLDRDRALVRRFQEGDDDAFDELYRRYHDRLERFCRKRVGDRDTAEEVTQEAFTRALTALPELAGEQRFYPWVSVIAARLCVDSYRQGLRSEPASDPDPGSVSGGQEAIIDAVDASLAVAALARLAPRHQDVLYLREVEGWSYQHIADHYEVTVGTVETLLFRARRALRREFHLVDRAGLLALPVVGWLIRGAARARHRIPSWVPSAPSPTSIAAAATATAAAVALAVVPFKPGIAPRADPAPVHALVRHGARTVALGQLAPAGARATATTSTTTVYRDDTAAESPQITPEFTPLTAPTVVTGDPSPTTTATVASSGPPGAAPAAGGDDDRDVLQAPVAALTSPVSVPPLGAVAAIVSGLPVVPALLGPIVSPGPTTTAVPNLLTPIVVAILPHR